MELVGSLMAGVGQVEDVAIALRIEHDGVLVGLCHDADKFLDDSLLLFFRQLVLLLQVEVILAQLGAEHVEGGVKVSLLEHGVGW